MKYKTDKLIHSSLEGTLLNNYALKKGLVENYYIDISYSSSLDDETDVIQYSASINNVNIDTDEHEKLGSASFSLYNLSLYENWTEVMEVADHHSVEECQLISVLEDGLDDLGDLWQKGILVHTFEIQVGVQQKGIGKESLNQMFSYWTALGVDFILLQAAPLNKVENNPNRKNNIARLINFYKRFGFEILQVSENETQGPIMIRYL